MRLISTSVTLGKDQKKQVNKLCDQISKISEKMENLIDQYAKTIK